MDSIGQKLKDLEIGLNALGVYDKIEEAAKTPGGGGGGSQTSGASTFLGLSDTPIDYVGQAARGIRVNATEDGLEYFTVPAGSTDEKVGVTSNDSTPDYLLNKLAAGSSKITLTELNDGGDEDVEIDVDQSQLIITESQISDLNHYTTADFDTDFGTKTTTDLSEGTNLYHTDERAQDAVGTILTDSATIDFTYNDVAGTITADVIEGTIDHGGLLGLTDDDHTQYTLLAGRAGGQSLIGGTASGDDLMFESTSNATKGDIFLKDRTLVGDTVFATASADVDLEVNNALYVGGRTALGGTFDIDPDITVVGGAVETHTTGAKLGMRFSSTVNPTANQDATATTYGMSFIVASAGAFDLNILGGMQGFTTNDSTGTAKQAAGGIFVVENKNTGTINSVLGVSASVHNTGAGSVGLGSAIVAASPDISAGSANLTLGVNIYNQGTALSANAVGLYVQETSGATTINESVRVLGGVVHLNADSGSTGDLIVEGDTDANNLVSDASADTVQVGAATTADSAKFYVSGKISTSAELEVNGDFNHDGTNVGFYAVAPVARPAAYTQTYATATRTHSNPTAASLTDSTGGTANQTVAAITAVGGSGATTTQEGEINDNFAAVTDEINKLVTDVANVKQVINQVIDDLQNNGLLQ